mmetsp:Transcript_30635/g.100963  ORF Transcript_30635/g.100963 Transcript_30635/m.100963 type:complete len:454 (+) Transcript_30635:553-1914(+)
MPVQPLRRRPLSHHERRRPQSGEDERRDAAVRRRAERVHRLLSPADRRPRGGGPPADCLRRDAAVHRSGRGPRALRRAAARGPRVGAPRGGRRPHANHAGAGHARRTSGARPCLRQGDRAATRRGLVRRGRSRRRKLAAGPVRHGGGSAGGFGAQRASRPGPQLRRGPGAVWRAGRHAHRRAQALDPACQLAHRTTRAARRRRREPAAAAAHPSRRAGAGSQEWAVALVRGAGAADESHRAGAARHAAGRLWGGPAAAQHFDGACGWQPPCERGVRPRACRGGRRRQRPVPDRGQRPRRDTVAACVRERQCRRLPAASRCKGGCVARGPRADRRQGRGGGTVVHAAAARARRAHRCHRRLRVHGPPRRGRVGAHRVCEAAARASSQPAQHLPRGGGRVRLPHRRGPERDARRRARAARRRRRPFRQRVDLRGERHPRDWPPRARGAAPAAAPA